MNKKIKEIGVDAGIIMICDEEYYKKYSDSPNFNPSLTKLIKIKPGTYRINWSIKNTWKGDISGSDVLSVESGRVIISDPCYCIRDEDWDKWLNDTDFGKHINGNAFIIDSMGGDGTYDIDLNLELVEEI